MRPREIAFRCLLILILIYAFFIPFEGPRPFEDIRRLVEDHVALLDKKDPQTGKESDTILICTKKNADGTIDPANLIELKGEEQIKAYCLNDFRSKNNPKLLVYSPLSWAEFSSAFPGIKVSDVYEHTNSTPSEYKPSGKVTRYQDEYFFRALHVLFLGPISFLLFLLGAYTYFPDFSSARVRAITYVAVAAALGLGIFLVKNYFLYTKDISFLQQYIKDIVPPKPLPGTDEFSNLLCSYLALVAIALAVVYPKKINAVEQKAEPKTT